MSDIEATITAHVRDIPDYPQPGVLFKDITPLLGDADAFGEVVEAMSASYGPVDKVVGIEARGFILAAPVAYEIRAGFVPVASRASCRPRPSPRSTTWSTAVPRSRSTRTRSCRGSGC